MNRELYSLSRGELIRRVYGNNNPNLSSIEPSIRSLMGKIDGAELVRYDRGFRIGDEFHAVYYISPEATVIRFDAEGDVKVTGIGTTDASIRETKDKIQKAFSH